MRKHHRFFLFNFYYHWREDFLPILWKFILAALAIADILTYSEFLIPIILSKSGSDTSLPNDEILKVCNSVLNEAGSSNSRQSIIFNRKGIVIIRWLFGIACVLDALLQGRRARLQGYENIALEQFERKLAEFYQSAAGASVPVVWYYNKNINNDNKDGSFLSSLDWEKIAGNTVRIWIPCASVLTFWIVLMPWPSSFWSWWWNKIKTAEDNNDANCFPITAIMEDTAPITIWILYMTRKVTFWINYLDQRYMKRLWKIILLRKKDWWKQPFRLIYEIRWMLRWLRYVRFAGPLLRMFMKVQGQVWDLYRTYKQSHSMTQKKRSLYQNRSLLNLEFKRIASIQRMKSSMRRMKSQFFREQTPHEVQQLLEPSLGQSLIKEKKKNHYLNKKIQQIQQQQQQNDNNESKEIASSDDINNNNATNDNTDCCGSPSAMYGQFVSLSRRISFCANIHKIDNKEVTTGKDDDHNKDQQRHRHHECLIAPNTRFAVIWRIVITGSLLIELWRLAESWRLNKNFSQTLPEILQNIFPQNMDAGYNNNNNKTDIAAAASSDRILITQAAGNILQYIVDTVCFLDIFVWYNTGRLVDGIIVVPKPFVSRCILPGTLSQIFDHPTLPTILPSILWRIQDIFQIVGYARAIRWCITIYPLLELLLLQPLISYLLYHSDSTNTTNNNNSYSSKRDSIAMSFVY